MSEGRLPAPKFISRERTAPAARAASSSPWVAERDIAVTAYDELWFQGRPTQP